MKLILEAQAGMPVWIIVLIIIILILIVFRENKWVKPITSYANSLAAGIISILVGSIVGFFVGYLMYGQILGVSVPISSIFSNNSDLENIFLGSIKQKVCISSIIGGVLGLIIYIIADSVGNNSKKKNNSTLSTSDELLKLNELKEKGIITSQEFDKQKQKILND
jgi:hypothetical protein